MEQAESLLVVGGGKMGEALVAGLLASGWAGSEAITVVESYDPRRKELATRHPDWQLSSSVGAAVAAGRSARRDGAPGSARAVIAVKPADVRSACAELAEAGISTVLSIAAGVTTASIEAWLGNAGEAAVVRAMPNTPALVGSGAAGIAGGSNATPADLEWARRVLEAVGTVVIVSEAALDAVTGLSGSGPAYVFLVAEALIDAGVLVGLPRPIARQLAVQTLLGSARLLSETGEEPSALRAQVTSPGGTTAAGVRALEAAGVRAALLDAVTAATQRAHELGAPPA